MIDHMEIESTILHKDSEEGKKQIKQREDSLDCKLKKIKIEIRCYAFRSLSWWMTFLVFTYL